jgi:hypothetical protein
LIGAPAIAEFLTDLLGEEVTADDVYYGASSRSKVQWPIGRLGKLLAASKRALTGHVSKALESRLPQSDVA